MLRDVKSGQSSEVTIFGGMCILPWTDSYTVCVWVTAQYAMLLSHVLLLFALCLPLFVMFKLLVLCFLLFFYVCFLVLCVPCFVLFCILFLPMYIVVYFLYVYSFTDHCHRV